MAKRLTVADAERLAAACRRKVRYPTKGRARDAIKLARSRYPDTGERAYYECSVCNGYHLVDRSHDAEHRSRRAGRVLARVRRDRFASNPLPSDLDGRGDSDPETER
jgi:hypothetical protein